MDFVERIFGFSPDGGDGTFELVLITAALLIGALIWMRWRRARSSS